MTVYFFLIPFLHQFIVFLMTLICILVGLVLGVTIQGISLTPAYVALTLTYYLSLENTELTRRLPSLLADRYFKCKEELKPTHNAQCNGSLFVFFYNKN